MLGRTSSRTARVIVLVALAACGRAGDTARGQGVADPPKDSSAHAWRTREDRHPEIASWLLLREASASGDSTVRSAIYDRVTLPLARTRIPWVEAAARERFADTLGALRAYTALPAPVTVLRLRGVLARTDAARDSVRHDVLAFIDTARSASATREAIALFDRAYTPDPTEQLAIARAAVGAGAWGRALTGYAAAPRAALTQNDLFHYADALARANRDREAAGMYATVTARELASSARYQGARAYLAMGDRTHAQSLLTSLSRGSDANGAAATALLADLATDDGADARARSILLDLARRFPKSRYAAPARFDAAVIAYILGNAPTAARELQALARTSPEDADAALYWAGRASDASGKPEAAAADWRAVLARDSTTYYAGLAAKRLGTRALHDFPDSVGYPHVPAVDSALQRIASLEDLGMTPEAALENDALFHAAPGDQTRLLATAAAFAGTDQASRAIALGRTALTTYGASPQVYRLIYPVAVRDTIVAQAKGAGIDPALVAALIRQESNFNPLAVSGVGARGLMQLMPSVARSIAPAAGITTWNPRLLFDPGINITLGVRHLAPLLHREPAVARVLAAYNAGESRVTRWARKRGASDPEVFTERIPFPETRDYVKSVLRNREWYQVLYPW